MSKKTLYKITKSYRNNSKTYYIKVDPEDFKGDWLLHSIGENTDGGHNYGYRMKARRIKKLPKGCKLLQRERVIQIY